MQPNKNNFITMKKIGIAAIALTVLTACNDKIGFVDRKTRHRGCLENTN